MDLDHEKFNISMRKFLKKVGVTSQQKIEEAVRIGLENNNISKRELGINVTLEIKELNLNQNISGQIILSEE